MIVNKSQITQAVLTLDVGEKFYVGPIKHQASIYSAIVKLKSKHEEIKNCEFSVRKLKAVDTNFTEIVDDVYEITRTN